MTRHTRDLSIDTGADTCTVFAEAFERDHALLTAHRTCKMKVDLVVVPSTGFKYLLGAPKLVDIRARLNLQGHRLTMPIMTLATAEPQRVRL